MKTGITAFPERGKKSTCLLLLFSLCALHISGCAVFKRDIIIPRSKIQASLDSHFPFDAKVVVASIRLDTPVVYFKEKNIGIKLRYSGGFLDKKLEGTTDFNGRITYRAEKGAFFLTDFEIVEATVNNAEFPANNKLQNILKDIIISCLAEYPFYTLKQKDFKQKLTKLLLKDAYVRGENLVLVLGT
jgi:hypothetical protein